MSESSAVYCHLESFPVLVVGRRQQDQGDGVKFQSHCQCIDKVTWETS